MQYLLAKDEDDNGSRARIAPRNRQADGREANNIHAHAEAIREEEIEEDDEAREKRIREQQKKKIAHIPKFLKRVNSSVFVKATAKQIFLIDLDIEKLKHQKLKQDRSHKKPKISSDRCIPIKKNDIRSKNQKSKNQGRDPTDTFTHFKDSFGVDRSEAVVRNKMTPSQSFMNELKNGIGQDKTKQVSNIINAKSKHKKTGAQPHIELAEAARGGSKQDASSDIASVNSEYIHL
jgi:hypothetical protein